MKVVILSFMVLGFGLKSLAEESKVSNKHVLYENQDMIGGHYKVVNFEEPGCTQVNHFTYFHKETKEKKVITVENKACNPDTVLFLKFQKPRTEIKYEYCDKWDRTCRVVMEKLWHFNRTAEMEDLTLASRSGWKARHAKRFTFYSGISVAGLAADGVFKLTRYEDDKVRDFEMNITQIWAKSALGDTDNVDVPEAPERYEVNSAEVQVQLSYKLSPIRPSEEDIKN